MGCVYAGNWRGECLLWTKGSPLNPEGADDEQGWCTAEDDENPDWCQSYESDQEEEEEVCDYCGEPFGFCAIDCESLEEDFDE